MKDKAEVLKIKPSDAGHVKQKSVQLDSGRRVLVHSENNEERIEIIEPDGDVVVTVRMTDEGPVVSVTGAHLELKSTETISLKAKKIKLQAEEEAVVESKGSLSLDASKKMDMHSDDDIRVNGKMIYLN